MPRESEELREYIGNTTDMLSALEQVDERVREYLGFTPKDMKAFIEDNYDEWYKTKMETKTCWNTSLRCMLKEEFVCRICGEVVRPDGTWYLARGMMLKKEEKVLELVPKDRLDEYRDIYDLLMDYGENKIFARAIAYGCLGSNHLYADMGFEDRSGVSYLMRTHFKGLYDLNVALGDMRWKKFFYKQLCNQAEINLCKSPTCNTCEDRTICFPHGV